MIDQTILNIIIKKIASGWINPKTQLPYVSTDIKNGEYRTEVEKYILETTEGV